MGETDVGRGVRTGIRRLLRGSQRLTLTLRSHRIPRKHPQAHSAHCAWPLAVGLRKGAGSQGGGLPTWEACGEADGGLCSGIPGALQSWVALLSRVPSTHSRAVADVG